MSRNRIILLVAAMFVLGVVAWFAFRSSPPHEHEFVPTMSAEAACTGPARCIRKST